MRGKPHYYSAELRKVRITPAGAGKTFQFVTLNTVSRDHPRRCGENCVDCCVRCSRIGSPPQVRGKPAALPWFRALHRITPAGAGKTSPGCPGRVLGWDHPRRCGENTSAEVDANERAGSPPRMRGKRLVAPPPPAVGRITPADAGKTSIGYLRLLAAGDHPRGCGENERRF